MFCAQKQPHPHVKSKMDQQLSFDDVQILGLPFVCMEVLSPPKIVGGK
jgi:hypothetical protein